MTVSADLAAADALDRMLAWLRGHTRVLAEFGGADHVSGQNRAPYPHLRVAHEAGGSDGDLRWLLKPELSLTAFGDLDGTLGSDALRSLLYVALAAAVELSWAPTAAGQSVVSDVRSSAAARPAPVPLTGQPAWAANVIVVIHPPT
jgi:hypothetical protein